MVQGLTLLLFASTVVSAVPQGASAPVMTRLQDVNAAYSVVMKSNNPVYLIAAKTATASVAPGMNKPIQSCVVLPSSYAADWAEILAEVDANRPGTGMIASDLKLDRPHVLLNEAEVQEFRHDRQQAWSTAFASAAGPLLEVVLVLGPSSNPKFQGARDMFLVSDVYFNRNRSIAATFVNVWSSPLAASWRWVVLQKTASGIWEERPQWSCLVGMA